MVYSTVDAPTRWPAVVAEIARQAGTPRGLLFTPFHREEEGGFWFDHNFGPGDIQAYIDYYYRTDLWNQCVFERGIPTNLPINCDTLVSAEELDRSEFYNDYLRHVDIRGAFSVMFAGEPGSFPRVHLSVYRPDKSERFEPGVEELMQRLTPHVHRALDLAFRFAALHDRRRDNLEALNRLDSAMAALGQDGAIVFMNQRAEQILSTNDGLSIRHQCIIAANTQDNESLWKLLRNTIGAQSKGKKSPGGSLTVSRPSGRRSYAVTVPPGAGLPSMAGVPAAWALVFIADPEHTARFPAARIARLYKLTSAEAHLAAALAAGQTLTEYAQDNELTMHTVRSALKQIFAKTDTHRQAELVRLLLATAAVDTDFATPDPSRDATDAPDGEQ